MNSETRNFFCYFQNACDDFEGLKSHVLAKHKDEAVPQPEGVINLTVNGQLYQICVEPEWTLNYLIHDKMGLTSPKMFCQPGCLWLMHRHYERKADSILHEFGDRM